MRVLPLVSRRFGGGPLRVLAVHGIFSQAQNLKTVAQTFACGVEAVDLRGHGASPWADGGGYAAADYLADCEAHLEQRVAATGRLWWYGHSLGGLLGLCAAARRPDLIAGVLAEDPPLFVWRAGLASRPIVAARFAQLAVARAESASIHALAARLGVVGPIRTDQGWLADLWASDPHIWSAILDDSLVTAMPAPWEAPPRVPVVLLQADPQRGGVLDDDSIQRLQAAAPRVARRFVPGAGHGIHTRYPDLVGHALRRSLRQPSCLGPHA